MNTVTNTAADQDSRPDQDAGQTGNQDAEQRERREEFGFDPAILRRPAPAPRRVAGAGGRDS